jgi:hypothetical protein
MNGKLILYVDQYGGKIWARTVAELCKKAGGSRASRMYRDKKDGRTVHCGYIVRNRWFEMLEPVELPA